MCNVVFKLAKYEPKESKITAGIHFEASKKKENRPLNLQDFGPENVVS